MEAKKCSLLLVLKVLEKYTDENHPLTYDEIIEAIKKEFDPNGTLELNFNRKTIQNNIELLRDDFDYDICHYSSTDKKENPSGKIGSYLGARDFDPSQIQVIMDALISSKFISSKDIKKYNEALYSHLSENQKNKTYEFINKTDSLSRNPCKDIHLNAEMIMDAIYEKKEISFIYQRYDETGKLIKKEGEMKRVCTPYYLINNFGNYYLLAASVERKEIRLYKMNYISDIEILGKSKLLKKDVKGMGKDFDIVNYLNENVYLYGTSKTPINAKVLIVQDKTVPDPKKLNLSSSIAYVKEWFGDKATIEKKGDDVYFRVKCSPDGLKFWLLQFGNKFEIIEPASLRKEVMNDLENILNRYKRENNKQ